MRGDDQHPDGMFSYRRPEQRVPADHPLWPIREMVDGALRELSPEFARLYPKTAPPSRPRSCSAPCCSSCSTPSGASASSWSSWTTTSCSAGSWASAMDDPVWDSTVFTKNRERLL